MTDRTSYACMTTICPYSIKGVGLPKPSYSIKARELLPAAQTGRIMITVERVIKKEKPRLMLIEGDTDTILAASRA